MSEEKEESVNLEVTDLEVNETTEKNKVVNLNINNDQKIDVLADGTEILREYKDEIEEPEEISDNNLRKLIEFITNRKNVSDEELDEIRNDEVKLQRLIKISNVKSKNFRYAPKKHFGIKYKKKRKKRNVMAKKSRKNNR